MVGWPRLPPRFRFTPKADVDAEGREVQRRANTRSRQPNGIESAFNNDTTHSQGSITLAIQLRATPL
jgi:hypothetical protein